MTLLQEYTSFLKENQLQELAISQLEITSKMDIPLMRLFSYLTQEQLMELTVKGLSDLLDSFIQGTALEKIREGLDAWENDKLGAGLKKEDIQPSDLLLGYAAQRQALVSLIPKFTESSSKAIQVVTELSDHYTRSEELAFQALFNIRKKAEDQLIESEERFRSLSQSAPDGIVIANRRQKVIYCNQSTATMLGYEEEEEITGLQFPELLPEHQRAEFKSFISGLFSAGRGKNKKSRVLETYGQKKNGLEIPLELSASCWETKDGRFYSYILHDVSERKKAELEIERKAKELSISNSDLEQFAYVASHDLKEPLRMVSNFTQLLQQKYAGRLDEDANEYIEFAVNGVKRMSDLINDLLSYSRIDRKDAGFQKVNLNKVVRGIIPNLAEAIQERKAEIIIGELPEILADPTQMVQLFQNLISNAVKFNNRKPLVEIGSEPHGKGWLFHVKDNGIGIKKDYAERIFAMFQRLNNRTEYPGTGIGLAICKKIVERHNGKIWIESTEGKGSTFFFTLYNKTE
jgi:PAS domain S-box-containing protein